ncbi:MAG: carotenoid biosynthesis protein [Flavobacteriales bacterium]
MKPIHAILILIILHTVGWLGLSSDFKDYFLILTPINLLISAILALKFQKKYDKSIILLLITSFTVGFITEVIGVQTSYLFGNYTYGTAMGPKIMGVPLMIGINWMILSYCAAEIVQRFMKPSIVRPIMGASLLLLLDYVLEPVAIKVGFWWWEGGDVPFYNYVCWFAIGFLLQLLFEKYHKPSNNIVAMWLFVIQFLFFICLQNNIHIKL